MPEFAFAASMSAALACSSCSGASPIPLPSLLTDGDPSAAAMLPGFGSVLAASLHAEHDHALNLFFVLMGRSARSVFLGFAAQSTPLHRGYLHVMQ